jgi:hypothetical protein
MKDPLCQINPYYAKMLHWTRLLWSNDFLFPEIILAPRSHAAKAAGPFH